MSVLICKNIASEGPGTLEDYLRSKKIPYKIVDLSIGESLAESENFDILIMMGGPMSVHEDTMYPYLRREDELVRQFASRGKRILGICLGAQILAKALGAQVYAGPQQEIGWQEIELTGEGLRDAHMRNLALHPHAGGLRKKFKVFHWHGETFDIPEGAVRLAGSLLYQNQAFRYGDKVYAFQFHIEASKEMIYDWLKNEAIDINKLKDDTEKFYDVHQSRALRFYDSFFTGTKNLLHGKETLTIS